MAIETVGMLLKARDELSAPIKRATKKVNTFGNSISSLARKAKDASLIIGVAVLGIIANSLRLAGAFEEASDKFDLVFGDAAPAARAELEKLAEALGRSSNKWIGFAATLQDTFVPLGFARDAAADMSVKLVALAADMSSLSDIPMEQVIMDLQTAVVGNTEVLRKYGVVAQELQIQNYALEKSIWNGTGAISAQEKALAILGLTYAGTADAQGNAADTATSFTNTMRSAGDQIHDFQIELGQKLTPIIAELVSDHLPGFIDALEGLIPLTESGAKALKAIIDNLDLLAPLIIGISGAIAALTIKSGTLSLAWVALRIKMMSVTGSALTLKAALGRAGLGAAIAFTASKLIGLYKEIGATNSALEEASEASGAMADAGLRIETIMATLSRELETDSVPALMALKNEMQYISDNSAFNMAHQIREVNGRLAELGDESIDAAIAQLELQKAMFGTAGVGAILTTTIDLQIKALQSLKAELAEEPPAAAAPPPPGTTTIPDLDTTASEIEAIMKNLEAIGQIDLHEMQAFSDAITEIHQQVIEMKPEQLREYFNTMTEEMREQYAEYLEWLDEAQDREAEAEEERQETKRENSEKAMDRITEEKNATLAAIEEAGKAQEAQAMKMLGIYRNLGEGLFKVGLRGGEGMEAWGKKVERIILDIITSTVFSIFFKVISGGAFSGLSAIFGTGKGVGAGGGLKFGTGGDIPTGGFRTAQAGLTIPDYGPIGDQYWVKTARGERVQPRDEVQMTKAQRIHNMLVAQAYGRGGGDINLVSRNSLLTEGELARVVTAVRRAQ